MAKFLLLLLYNALFPIGLLFMAPAAWRKMKARGGSARDLLQRAGFFRPEQRRRLQEMQQAGPLVWMHAASVGEVGIAAKLIREMLRQQSHARFVLTTTTPTGYAQAREMKPAQAGHVLPLFSALDGWMTVRRFLNAIRPAQLVLVEAEVWPNLTFACQRRNIPMFLVNARMSPRSERRFRKALPFTRAVFSSLTQVLVQEPEDIARWQSLGLAPQQIALTGSIKFDTGGLQKPGTQIQQFQLQLQQLGWQPADPILLLASTHPGEETALAKIYQAVRQTHPGLRLIVVPRHVERALALREELRGIGLRVALRCDDSEPAPHAGTADVLLVNTTGELRAWQYLATVVVIGKSFLAHGGQNPAEAVMAGRPVILGPHMENFSALVARLLAHQGALQVTSLAALEPALHQLLTHPETAATLAENGLRALQPHEGATRRTTSHLLGGIKL